MSICSEDINELRQDNYKLEQKKYFIEKYGEKEGIERWNIAPRRFFFLYDYDEKCLLQSLKFNINSTIKDKKDIIIDNQEFIKIKIEKYNYKCSLFLIKDINNIVEKYCSNDLLSMTYFSLLKKEDVVKLNFFIENKNYEDEYDRFGEVNKYNLSLIFPLYLLCKLLLHNPNKIDDLLMKNKNVFLEYLSIGIRLFNELSFKNKIVYT